MVLVLLCWVLVGVVTVRFLANERVRLKQPVAPGVTIPELPLDAIRTTAARAQSAPPPAPSPSPAPSPPTVLD